ncbi:MAG: hypothetical protein ACE5F2_00715 [Candidatus Paceibacteria bacterium]
MDKTEDSKIEKYKKANKKLAKLLTKKNDENAELYKRITDLEKSNAHISGKKKDESVCGVEPYG